MATTPSIFWPNNVGSCCVRLHVAKRLRNKSTCKRVGKRTQHITSNNIESWWPTMLRPFAWGFRVYEKDITGSETYFISHLLNYDKIVWRFLQAQH